MVLRYLIQIINIDFIMNKILFSFLFISFLACACNSGPVNYPVAGTVLLDGKPVGAKDDAVIRFETTDNKGNTSESFIVEGNYLVKLTEGNYKVSLNWVRKTGKILKSKIAGPGQETELAGLRSIRPEEDADDGGRAHAGVTAEPAVAVPGEIAEAFFDAGLLP